MGLIETHSLRPPTTDHRPLSHFRFQVSGFRFQVSSFRFQVSSFKFQLSSFRFQVSSFKFQLSSFIFTSHGLLLPQIHQLRAVSGQPEQVRRRYPPCPFDEDFPGTRKSISLTTTATYERTRGEMWRATSCIPQVRSQCGKCKDRSMKLPDYIPESSASGRLGTHEVSLVQKY